MLIRYKIVHDVGQNKNTLFSHHYFRNGANSDIGTFDNISEN